MIPLDAPSLSLRHVFDSVENPTPESLASRPPKSAAIGAEYSDSLEWRPSNESTTTTLLEHARQLVVAKSSSPPPPTNLERIQEFRQQYTKLVKSYAPHIPYMDGYSQSPPVLEQACNLNKWLSELALQPQHIRDTVLAAVSRDLTGLRQPTRTIFGLRLVNLAEDASLTAQAKVGENLADCLPFASQEEAKLVFPNLLSLVRNMHGRGDTENLRASVVQKLEAYFSVLPVTAKHENLMELAAVASTLPSANAIDVFETCFSEAVRSCSGQELREVLDELKLSTHQHYHTAAGNQGTLNRLKKLSQEINQKLQFNRIMQQLGRSN